MQIDKDLCIACGECIFRCPVQAISLIDDLADIDSKLCTECGNCLRSDVCPVDALVFDESIWPRTIRNIFSDPISVFSETGVSGRGTEESKTNDVTARFQPGEVGFTLDVGRPNAGGVHLREVEKICQGLAELGIIFDPDNPVTYLMADKNSGSLKPEVLDEFVVSAVIEFKTSLMYCPKVIKKLENIAGQINTVFSVGVISRVIDGKIEARKELEDEGFFVRPAGKTTLNLGRA